MTTTRNEMVEEQLVKRGVSAQRVISAMREVDRALFAPEDLKERASDDTPLPIAAGQTISQPYIVAYTAQSLKLDSGRVLEIGSGCDYNAAVLSRICAHVYTIEVVEELAQQARENLKKAGIDNVSVRHGDGYQGWDEEAPFDA